MKVLWFTNTSCSAAPKLGLSSHSGSWLVSLEKALSRIPEIELTIAFYHHVPLAPFNEGNVRYIPIFRAKAASKLGRALQRTFNNLAQQDQKELSKLLEVTAGVKPDLIHVHGTEENFGLLAETGTTPVLVSIQGIMGAIAGFYFAGLSRETIKKHSPLLHKVLENPFLQSFDDLRKRAVREKKILLHTKHIMGRTAWDRRITKLMAPRSTYYSGGELLRPEFFSSTWNQTDPGAVLKIMTVLNDSPYKGLETIVSAARLITESGRKLDWKIIGINKKSKTVQLVQTSQKIDFAALGITLLGACDAKQIIETGLDAHFYCQASHIENSPNSLCEAMALGMPVIASDAGGTSTLVTGEVDGILIQPGSPYALAGTIIDLSSNFELARQLGKNAREKAVMRHQPETVTDAVIAAYKQIVKTNKP